MGLQFEPLPLPKIAPVITARHVCADSRLQRKDTSITVATKHAGTDHTDDTHQPKPPMH